jgi:hypothetical protein
VPTHHLLLQRRSARNDVIKRVVPPRQDAERNVVKGRDGGDEFERGAEGLEGLDVAGEDVDAGD